MSIYVIELVGLSAAVILIGVYGYIDYMSDRHLCDMYTGLRDMFESLKERLRILEDTVEAMKSTGDRMKAEDTVEVMKNTNERMKAEEFVSNCNPGTINLNDWVPLVSDKWNKVKFSEPMDIVTDEDIEHGMPTNPKGDKT